MSTGSMDIVAALPRAPASLHDLASEALAFELASARSDWRRTSSEALTRRVTSTSASRVLGLQRRLLSLLAAAVSHETEVLAALRVAGGERPDAP